MNNQLAPHAEQVRQLFDAKAPTWSAKYEVGGKLTGRLTRLMEALLSQVPPGSCVLDLGCGTGELARALATAGMRVAGCDISVEMLRQAARLDADDAVEWVELDTEWRTLPFKAESFDAVMASSLLEYIGDPGHVLAQCSRVLRSGGLVVCTVPDARHPLRWFESWAAIASRTPASEVGRRWTWAERYLSYLQVSQRRHSARWWRTAARQAGLSKMLRVHYGFKPLRMFMFRKGDELNATS